MVGMGPDWSLSSGRAERGPGGRDDAEEMQAETPPWRGLPPSIADAHGPTGGGSKWLRAATRRD
jgi:hypothetical protein